MDEKKHIYDELLKITQKHEYTINQLNEKNIANSFLQPLGNPSNFFLLPRDS